MNGCCSSFLSHGLCLKILVGKLLFNAPFDIWEEIAVNGSIRLRDSCKYFFSDISGFVGVGGFAQYAVTLTPELPFVSVLLLY